MKKVAITLGKFWPFHIGHELMINSALATHNKVFCIVSHDDISKAEQSAHIISEHFQNRKLKVIFLQDDTSSIEYDENGTATDEEYLNNWAKYLSSFHPDTIVTSDLYGKVLAEKMNIDWLPVDPDRKVFPISATSIRKSLYSGWKFLPSTTKLDMAQRIAIIGPESTGKSTIVDYISSMYNAIGGIPEWGRTISEIRENQLTYNDFVDIIKIQNMMIKSSCMAYPYVLTDTEAITTHLFAKKYLSKIDADIFSNRLECDIDSNSIDHYILLSPTVEWVDDGTRIIHDTTERLEFYNDLKEMSMTTGKPVHIVDSSNYETRKQDVINIISEVIRESPLNN
jgi:HTH-type transcriptional repressor of NAD biosynthesis genes